MPNTVVCPSCFLVEGRTSHGDDPLRCIEAQRRAMRLLLEKLPASVRACKLCQQQVVCIQVKDDTANGGKRPMEFDWTGQPHAISCANAPWRNR